MKASIVSVLGFASGLSARPVENIAMNAWSCGSRGNLPIPHLANDENHQRQPYDEIKNGHHPGDQAKALFGGLNIDDAAVLGDESIDDLLFGFALGEVLIDFLQHALGGVTGSGERAARVCATPRGHIAAAAHAFE